LRGKDKRARQDVVDGLAISDLVGGVSTVKRDPVGFRITGIKMMG